MYIFLYYIVLVYIYISGICFDIFMGYEITPAWGRNRSGGMLLKSKSAVGAAPEDFQGWQSNMAPGNLVSMEVLDGFRWF